MKSSLIPGSIVLAGIIIAIAVIVSNGNPAPKNEGGSPSPTPSPVAQQAKGKKINLVEGDHLRGNPDAEIVIVEYSDYECPFCARHHDTMIKLLEEYDGEVAWVYRHYPLGFHPQAAPAAYASECVAEMKGNDAFWAFTDGLFANQESLGQTLFVEEASKLGISASDLSACMERPDIQKLVSDSISEGNSISPTGQGLGTPYNVVISGDTQIPVSGAQPIENFRSTIDSLL